VIAADRVSVGRERPDGPALAAEFVSEEFAGAAILFYFETADGTELKAQVDEAALEALAPEPGDPLALLAPEAAHLIGAEEG
jgi:spermidine/putrescine transport system ATP-binding protein